MALATVEDQPLRQGFEKICSRDLDSSYISGIFLEDLGINGTSVFSEL